MVPQGHTIQIFDRRSRQSPWALPWRHQSLVNRSCWGALNPNPLYIGDALPPWDKDLLVVLHVADISFLIEGASSSGRVAVNHLGQGHHYVDLGLAWEVFEIFCHTKELRPMAIGGRSYVAPEGEVFSLSMGLLFLPHRDGFLDSLWWGIWWVDISLQPSLGEWLGETCS